MVGHSHVDEHTILNGYHKYVPTVLWPTEGSRELSGVGVTPSPMAELPLLIIPSFVLCYSSTTIPETTLPDLSPKSFPQYLHTIASSLISSAQ